MVSTMSTTRDLDGRIETRHIAVTGAGTGIGRAIALRLAREGPRLSLMARDVARLQEAGEEARRAGAAGVAWWRCDIRAQAQVDEAFAAAAREHGPLHALIANSGIGGANAPGPGDRFDELVSTNLSGTYYCLRAAQRQLAPGPGVRHLVAISSVLARFGVPGHTGYCAAKAGVLGLVRALAHELAQDNVQVNALCPGWVDTAMAARGIREIAEGLKTSYDVARRRAVGAVPLRRMSEPKDVAGVVAWLLSEDARGITGQAIDVNNGAWMG
jgi:NAD(P)-dependent dehydrogenase (short-subunit alcohol dehydrogenase family)